VLLRAVLDTLAAGDQLDVLVASRGAALELPGWARVGGHEVVDARERKEGGGWLVRIRRGATQSVLAGPLPAARPAARLRSGHLHTAETREPVGQPPDEADPAIGFVPLGAIVEAGGPAFAWTLNRRDQVWSDDVAQLVDGASAARWDAARDIPWRDAAGLPAFLERAVCQGATFIAQNELAAYYVPARFLAGVNPEYLEVLAWLASHVHDEARHVEVFTRRALVNGGSAYALAATQRSLHSLLEERDFTASALLLNVLGEGSFLDLLQFVAAYAPDAATRTAARRAPPGRRRRRHIGDPAARERLVGAAEARAARLTSASGMSPVVTDALTVMAAGSLQPAQLSEGAAAVAELMTRTVHNRIARLLEAGFDERTARRLSDLHTPNLM
jgi:TusA-related sulfurtransferase